MIAQEAEGRKECSRSLWFGGLAGGGKWRDALVREGCTATPDRIAPAVDGLRKCAEDPRIDLDRILP
jgi:hypothetical protein